MKAVYYFGKGKVPCKGFVPEKSLRNDKKSLCAGKSPLQSVHQSQKIPVKTLQVIRYRREKSLRLDGSDWLTDIFIRLHHFTVQLLQGYKGRSCTQSLS